MGAGDERGRDGFDRMSFELPADLKSALDTLIHGRSRRDMAPRAEAMSQHYRAGAGSAFAVRGGEDALAYALTRMPATFAAASAALAALHELCPDFAPRTIIDAGAGPGTATWAAVQRLGEPADVRLIDDNPHLRALALTLLASSATAALRNAAYDRGDLTALLPAAAPADLVIASYVIGEAAPGALAGLADTLWSASGNMLAVIEAGTPAGFLRIRDLRAHLLARGAHVVAPCPHDHACPIVAPDWCHFSQRLSRSRDHRQVKGASLSFEDEKFSYVVLARQPPRRIDARVLAHPRGSKGGVSAKLCTADGIVTAVADRRDRAPYRLLKRWSWGDAVTRADEPRSE
jgi:ribosomal protein RSM22 (predicted rRNA methylase)